jgi:hypothetical protein
MSWVRNDLSIDFRLPSKKKKKHWEQARIEKISIYVMYREDGREKNVGL